MRLFSVLDNRYINQTVVAIYSLFDNYHSNDKLFTAYTLYLYGGDEETKSDLQKRLEYCKGNDVITVKILDKNDHYIAPPDSCIKQECIDVVLARLEAMEREHELMSDGEMAVHLDLDVLYLDNFAPVLEKMRDECSKNKDIKLAGIDEARGNFRYLAYTHTNLPNIYINFGFVGIRKECLKGVVAEFKEYLSKGSNVCCLEQDYFNYKYSDKEKLSLPKQYNTMNRNLEYFKYIQPVMVHYLGSCKPFKYDAVLFNAKSEYIFFDEYLGYVQKYRYLLDKEYVDMVKSNFFEINKRG